MFPARGQRGIEHPLRSGSGCLTRHSSHTNRWWTDVGPATWRLATGAGLEAGSRFEGIMIIRLLIIIIGFTAFALIVGTLAGKLLFWSGRKLSCL